jgi:hypothetical protein
MTKRIALLAGIAMIAILSVAPDAMATHCFRCRWYFYEQTYDCFPLPGPVLGGRPFCETDGITCQTSGDQCAPHTASVAPLASEYTVASVTRLDEPGSRANETRVAQTQIAQSTTRSTK